MLVVVQFPFADLRRFVSCSDYRLAAPPFPLVVPGQHFVRSTGQVKVRPQGSPCVWPEDGRFCDARSALRLYGISGKKSPAETRRRHWQCAFRRFYSDGRSSSRLEVGFVCPTECEQTISTSDLIKAVLDIPVSVPDIDGPRKHTHIAHAGRPLAKHFLHATTAVTSDPSSIRPWWLSPGRPLVLVQYDARQALDLPKGTHIKQFSSDGIRLDYANINYRGTSTSTWYLGFEKGANRATFRELRLHLMRLHSEMQCMMLILQSAQSGKLASKPHTPEFDALQQFLNDSLRLIRAKRRYGLPQAPLLQASLSAVDAVPQEEADLLLSELSFARRQIREKVEAYAAQTRNRQSTMIFTGGGPVVTGDWRNYNIDVGGDFSGVVGEHNTVQDSLNRIEQSDVSDDVKDALKELTAAAAQLYQNAPPEIHEKVQSVPKDVDNFCEEALEAEPRQSILKAIGDGLKKAAQAADELGKPVIQLVTSILKLLS